jgi:hypothetical protein
VQKALKNIGSFLLFPIGFLIVVFVGALFVGGIVWVSAKVLPWLSIASYYAFGICLFVLSPLCIFRKTRPWAGVGFVYASFVFGMLLFAYSCLFVLDVWGTLGLVIGLFMAGVGVVPVALLAALLHAQWSIFFELLFGVFLTFGTRILGAWFSRIQEPEYGRISESDAIEMLEQEHGI